MAVLTVHLINGGQDILEFDIVNSQIIDSRPTGEKAWKNFQIITPEQDIKLGTLLQVQNRKLKDAAILTIRHPVLKVERQNTL